MELAFSTVAVWTQASSVLQQSHQKPAAAFEGVPLLCALSALGPRQVDGVDQRLRNMAVVQNEWDPILVTCTTHFSRDFSGDGVLTHGHIGKPVKDDSSHYLGEVTHGLNWGPFREH